MPRNRSARNPVLTIAIRPRRSPDQRAPRTKTGCWTCRERKVRCDEGKPTCAICLRLGLPCAGYEMRIRFQDCTASIAEKFKDTRDTRGCPVYESSLSPSLPQVKECYKIYTASYFVTHEDVETDAEVESPEDMPNSWPQQTLTYSSAPQQTPSYSCNYESAAVEGHRLQQQWHSAVHSNNGPMPTMAHASLSHDSNAYPHNHDTLESHFSQSSAAQPSRSIHLTTGYIPGKTHPLTRFPSYEQQQPISQAALATHERQLGQYQPRDGSAGLMTPNSITPPLYSSYSKSGPDHNGNQQGPPNASYPNQYAPQSQTANQPQAGGTDALESCQEVVPKASILWQDVPESLHALIDAVVSCPQDRKDARSYVGHYLTTLAGQLIFPDRGAINPFRVLITTLCPSDPVLLKAILAFSVTDLAHNDPSIDSVRGFLQAQRYYDEAVSELSALLDDETYNPSTAALAAAFFILLTDVKNAWRISQTSLALRIIQTRARAGKLYEGGVCWTWSLASIGVCSAAFGGSNDLMSYLVETQLPNPGQGNMYPFIKKTEEQRKEHTMVSPMYASIQGWWVMLSTLSNMANGADSHTDEDFRASVSKIKDQIESDWSKRPQLVDSLTSGEIDMEFRTKWILGPPLAELIVCAYHSSRLYVELLVRGTYTLDELRLSVSRIVSIFDSAAAKKELFQRRHFLLPIFVCSIMSPDFSVRKQIINKLAQSVSTEASWNKALGVANALLQEEMYHGTSGSPNPTGYGTIRWSHVRDKLGCITLY